MKELIYPKKVVYYTDGVLNASALFKVSYPQIGLNEPELCTLPAGASIILDFGLEYCGGVRILAHGGTALARIRVGESVSETSAELGEKGACNDHSLRDISVPLPDFSDSEYFKSGFRFVRIDNLGKTNLTLKKVLLVFTGADLTQKGSFVCDDERINEIFNTAARTLYLNAQNGVLYDGIKRDRLVWVGDLHPEVLAFLGLYDDYSYIRNCLDFCIEQTPLPSWMNGMPTYSQWFLVIVKEYILHTGDNEFLAKYKDYIYDTTKQVANCIGDDGRIYLELYFLDWPSRKFADEGENGIAGLCKKAIISASEILQPLGYDFNAVFNKLALLEQYYETPCDYKQGAAIRIFGGLNQTADVIVKDGVKGFSTFMSYYMLDAVAMEYGSEKATELMKEYYGGMLDIGATTFFEDFNIEWLKNAGRIDEIPDKTKKDVHGDYGDFCYRGFRHSLCHGWASGVIQYLQRTVAGAKILETGCKKITVKPNVGNLKWFKMEMPTPYGIIRVEYDGKIVNTSVPKNVELI